MFKKKKCRRCGEKISSSDSFCSNCGNRIADGTDYGMLGKNDMPEFPAAEIRLPKGFNMIFNSLMKNLDKQFREFDKELGKDMEGIERIPKPDKQNRLPPGVKQGGISISISTAGDKPPQIKVKSAGNIPEFKQREQAIKESFEEIEKEKLTGKKLEKFSTLPQSEPETNIRRLSDSVIYEIDLPGVKSKKDISIIKLENSIEIKAIAKEKAYFKLIPISLPIISHNLSKEKLILEFGERD